MKRTITVGGVGRTMVAPDQAEIRLGIEATRTTAAEARNEAAAVAERVLAAVEGLGVAPEDTGTVDLDLMPEYDQTSEGRRLVGQRIRHVLLVRVRDLDVLGSVVDVAIEAGAATVDGISFESEDPSVAEDASRAAAMHDARGRADQLAAEAGVKRGRLLQVVEGLEAWPAPREGVRAAAMMAATQVRPGTREVVVHVRATYEIGRR